MKKLLALATAASVVAMATGANAESSGFTLGLSGTVPPFINVASSTDVSCSPGTCTSGGDTSARTATLVNFANSSGIVQNFEGGSTASISSNAPFTASLASTNGGLSDGTHDVIAYNMKVGSQDFTTASTAPQTEDFGYSSTAQPVLVGFQVNQGTTAVAAGAYSDTLTLTVTTN